MKTSFKAIFTVLLSLLISFCGQKVPEAMQTVGHCDELTRAMFDPEYAKVPKLVGVNGTYWQKDTLKVLFLDGSESLKAENLSYFKEWEKYCRIRIQRTEVKSEADISVTFAKGGAWSYIGSDSRWATQNKGTSMQLGWNAQLQTSNPRECKGTAMHEFGHALGFAHEHQSPNFPCTWNVTLLYPDYKKMFGWDEAQTKSNIVDRYSATFTNSSVYDPTSIMHYEFNPKYVNAGCPINTVRRLDISPIDQKHAGTLYPFKIIVPGPVDTITKPGNYVLVSKGKPATQSSTATFPAKNVNDGDYNTFNHTLRETYPWVKIDLQSSYNLTKIKIKNRTCSACVKRLRSFKVFVSNAEQLSWTSSDLVYSYNAEVKDGEQFDIPVKKSGRYVTVMADNNGNPYPGFLHLAEVEAYTGDGIVPVCKDSVYKVSTWVYVAKDSIGKVCR